MLSTLWFCLDHATEKVSEQWLSREDFVRYTTLSARIMADANRLADMYDFVADFGFLKKLFQFYATDIIVLAVEKLGKLQLK